MIHIDSDTVPAANPPWDYDEAFASLAAAHHTLDELVHKLRRQATRSPEMNSDIIITANSAIRHLTDVIVLAQASGLQG